MSRFRINALVACLTLAFANPIPATAFQSVTTGNVNLRTGAGVAHTRIATVPLGTMVHVERCGQGWCLVETLGLTGWMSASYLAAIGTGTGVVQRYNPETVPSPPVAKFDFVVPRTYHELGNARYHKLNRNFHP